MKLWECQYCGVRKQTRMYKPHTPMHRCPEFNGIEVPFIKKNQSLIVNTREDYIGDESVLLDTNGKPIMSVTVDKGDKGNDVYVYAPVATAKLNVKD